MKQKVVIQVSLMNGNKSRSKAMRIAVAASGVESVSFKDDKSQMEVTGELDAAILTQLLRKKVRHADLLSVSPAGGEKKEDDKPKELPWPYIYYNNPVPYAYYEPAVARDAWIVRSAGGSGDGEANFQACPYYNAVPDYEHRVATGNCFPLCTRPLTRSGHF